MNDSLYSDISSDDVSHFIEILKEESFNIEQEGCTIIRNHQELQSVVRVNDSLCPDKRHFSK